MNFFRSEEHMRNWAQLNPDHAAKDVMPLAGWMARFSGERFKNRLRPDYVSWYLPWKAEQAR